MGAVGVAVATGFVAAIASAVVGSVVAIVLLALTAPVAGVVAVGSARSSSQPPHHHRGHSALSWLSLCCPANKWSATIADRIRYWQG